MPARQHPSSFEAALSSSPASPNPKSSLRRLSSLANLHQLNPFNRRRSSHGTQNSDDDPYLLNTYQQRSQYQQRRQSYMSLSEDPMPALPKSRTFNNLPLPRNRNNSKPPVSMGPPSRIPTPSMGPTAKSRFASATRSILKVGNRRGLVRSDTEPLLASHHSPGVPALAGNLKENVSLSATKPETKLVPLELPEVPMVPLDINIRSPKSTLNPLKRPQTPTTRPSKPLPRRDSLQPPPPRTPVSMIPSGKHARTPTTATSNPRRRTILPPDVVPLHYLCDKGKQRSSFSSDIQSRQLLAPRAAPTPPPSSCPRPSATCLHADDATSNINIASDLVTSAQSTAYWSGRLMSQFDRRRNEQLQACVGRADLSLSYPENDLNVCLRELQKKCVTEAAKLSFAMFKARVYVKAGTLGTTKGMAESGAEGRGKYMVEA